MADKKRSQSIIERWAAETPSQYIISKKKKPSKADLKRKEEIDKKLRAAGVIK